MIKYYQDNTSKKLKVCEFVDGEMELIVSSIDYGDSEVSLAKGDATIIGTGVRFNAEGSIPTFKTPGMYVIDRSFYKDETGELMLVIGNHNTGKLHFAVGDTVASVAFFKFEKATAVNTPRDLNA